MPPGKRQGKKVPEDQPATATVASDMAEAHTPPDLISILQHIKRRDEQRREEKRRDEQRREEERQRDEKRQQEFAALSTAFNQVTNLSAANSGVTSSSSTVSHPSSSTSPPPPRPPTHSRAPPQLEAIIIPPPPLLQPDTSYQAFRDWRRRWRDYSVMADLATLPLSKVHIQLRACLSPEMLHVLHYRLQIPDDDSTPIEDIITTLDEHFKAQTNEALRRHELFSCRQMVGERFNGFYVRIRVLCTNQESRGSGGCLHGRPR